jgi:hypothetical protein
MIELSRAYIRDQVADSRAIYQRGVGIYEIGSFLPGDAAPEKGYFSYVMDGNYGEYDTVVQIRDGGVEASCDCPYPGPGCKHIVAALLDARDVMGRWKDAGPGGTAGHGAGGYLSREEIRTLALEDRKRRARTESFTVDEGEMLKGERLVHTENGRTYRVTLHDPATGQGHCSCPDYLYNCLGTCKHLIFLSRRLSRKRGFKKRLDGERFPYVDLYWDSESRQPAL